MLIWTIFLFFGMLISCPKFVLASQLQSAYWKTQRTTDNVLSTAEL
jgi:hypothetical protein